MLHIFLETVSITLLSYPQFSNGVATEKFGAEHEESTEWGDVDEVKKESMKKAQAKEMQHKWISCASPSATMDTTN